MRPPGGRLPVAKLCRLHPAAGRQARQECVDGGEIAGERGRLQAPVTDRSPSEPAGARIVPFM